FTHLDEPAVILVNENQTPSSRLALRLVGTRSNRDGIGARIILETSAGRHLRNVCGGGSYLSQSPYTQMWGIPAGTEIGRLIVKWPSGAVQQVEVQSDASRIMLVEPLRGS